MDLTGASDNELDNSPTLRRSKQSVKDEEEKDRLERTKETKEWFNANRVTHQLNVYDRQQGKAIVHVGMLEHPEMCIEARVRRDDVQEKVYKSMKTLGVGRYDIVVLIWTETLEELDIGYDQIPASPANTDLRFQVICGDHTTASVQRLHRENPDDPQYKTVAVEVIACNKTQENIRLAYNMGRLDNELKEMTTGTTAWDIVVKIHNVHVETAAKHISDKAKKKILDHEFQEIFKGVSGQYTKNTFGSLRVLGSKTGKLWDNIHKLFGIPVKKKVPKGQSKPVAPSVGHFYHMADIPEAKLVQWSNRFFQYTDPWNSLMFKKRCDSYKKEQRVKGQIRDYVNVVFPECDAKNWKDLVEFCPIFGSEEKVDSWINMMDEKAKSQLIPYIKTAISAAIEQYKKAKATPSKADTPDVHFLLWLGLIFLFCYHV